MVVHEGKVHNAVSLSGYVGLIPCRVTIQKRYRLTCHLDLGTASLITSTEASISSHCCDTLLVRLDGNIPSGSAVSVDLYVGAFCRR